MALLCLENGAPDETRLDCSLAALPSRVWAGWVGKSEEFGAPHSLGTHARARSPPAWLEGPSSCAEGTARAHDAERGLA